MELDKLKKLVQDALEDMKAVDINEIDVRNKSTMTDCLFFATGNSTRHVKAIAVEVASRAKEAGIMPLGTEGLDVAEWVLVDLNDIIVHVMLQSTRDFYELEKLWEADDATDQSVEAALAQKQ